MAKRLGGRVAGVVKKVGLPVAARLADRAAAALEAADRALEERLARARKEKAEAAPRARAEKASEPVADAPARPRRVVRRAQPQPAGKTRRAPAKKPAGPKVKRGQKHTHDR